MAYTNHGYETADIDAANIDVTISGAPADSISVVNNDDANTEVSLKLNPDRDDDGVPFVIRAGSVLTMSPGSIYGFFITRTAGSSASTVDVYWW
jgi:hypothetical protein